MTHYFVTRSDHELDPHVYMVVYRGNDGQLHLEASYGTLREARRTAEDLNQIANEHAEDTRRDVVREIAGRLRERDQDGTAPLGWNAAAADFIEREFGGSA